jgi:glycosyltransferase involved in cell wall biosynthesis
LRVDLAALGFRGLRVVARGVDTVLFNPARRSDELRAGWGAKPEDPVLLHVGRIAPEKNLDALLAAYGAARLRAPRARLVLVGDGPARRELQARCPRRSCQYGAARNSPRTMRRPTSSVRAHRNLWQRDRGSHGERARGRAFDRRGALIQHGGCRPIRRLRALL